MSNREHAFESGHDHHVEVGVEVAEVGFDAIDILFERIERHFHRVEVKKRARQYFGGLIAPIERKTARSIAAYAGERACDSMERFLTTAKWSADGIMADLRSLVVEAIGDANGILVITPMLIWKKGTKSVGISPDTATMGYQEALFLGYVAPRGCAFLDRRLYIDDTWLHSRRKRKAARIPESVQPDTLADLANKMLEAADTAQVPHAWVVLHDRFLYLPTLYDVLQQRRQPFILSMHPHDGEQYDRDLYYIQREHLRDDDRKGRVWTAIRLEQPYAGYVQWFLKNSYDPSQFEERPRHVARRDTSFLPPVDSHFDSLIDNDKTDGNVDEIDFDEYDDYIDFDEYDDSYEPDYYLALAPDRVGLQELVEVVKTSQQVHPAMQAACEQAGLNHYEARSWPAWHRHTAFALLAHAYLTLPYVNVDQPLVLQRDFANVRLREA